MIVITAPTGNIGSALVRRLVAADVPLRLILRDPAKLDPDLRPKVEIVEGSHGDAATVDRAFEGAEAVFWLTPPQPHKTLEDVYLEFARPAAAALARYGVARVVSVSALGRGTRWENVAGQVTASIRMNDMLMASGAAMRELAMPSFMDNLKWQIARMVEQGEILECIDADTKIPMIATRDIAEVAAGLLLDKSWTDQQELPIVGPGDLTYAERAAIVSEVINRPVAYKQLSYDAVMETWQGRSASPSFTQGFVGMMRSKNEGMDAEGAARAPQRTTTTFREWCETELKAAVEAYSARG